MILMNDLKSDPEELIKAELAACERVLRSGYWILGPEVASFEAQWSDYLGIKHTVGCGNGMDAIEIGLRALGIGAGDEVITTPMTAFATVLAIMRSGATPVLADIDLDTAMLNPDSVIRCITKCTKAIILVNLYGQIGAVEVLTEIAKNKGIYFIEDCAQSHGAKAQGKPSGSFGILAAWSFYPTKNLGAVGDGGALTTDDADIAEQARFLGNYGQSVRYHHPLKGLNSRLDELQAAILKERLKYLNSWTNRRREIAETYSVSIVNHLVKLMPLPEDKARHVHHLFVVTCDQRDALQLHLKDKGVNTLIHYPIPVHKQEPCFKIRRDPHGLFNAEKHAATCLSLPCHPGMTDEQIRNVTEAVNSFK